jgi:hypothetical protein
VLLAMAASVTSARWNEIQKEQFFEFMNGMPEGRQFLSSIAQKIMDRTQHMLLFNYAPAKKMSLGSGFGDFLGCQTCKLTVSGFDSQIRSQVVTLALEEFSIQVCHMIET